MCRINAKIAVFAFVTLLATIPAFGQGSACEGETETERCPESLVFAVDVSASDADIAPGAATTVGDPETDGLDAAVPIPALGFRGLLMFVSVLTATGIWVLRADDR